MKHYRIYSDGGCSGNPGPGGWGSLIDGENGRLELSGGDRDTTNNRMELTAVIKALERCRSESGESFSCSITTDSQYVQKGISEWIHGWKRNGWRTASKAPVKNKDLWMRLDELTQGLQIEWKWVKGHAGHPENERCDELAGMEMAKFR